MPFFLSYGCSTAAGRGVSALADVWKHKSDVSRDGAFYFAGEPEESVLERLTAELVAAFAEACRSGRPAADEKFGVLLASTKGISQDFIHNRGAERAHDPLTPLLDSALDHMELAPARALCVSNACSSTLAAVRLAEIWLQQDLNSVLILAADAVTPFVQKGFASLKLLAPERPREFDRRGFWLGEAAAALWLTNTPTPLQVQARLDCDGSIVTRPAASGASLKRAIRLLPLTPQPDWILAHGTGTEINEETEAPVLNELFPEVPRRATKPYFGHTLGASAAIDLIAAAEGIRAGDGRRVLITSLGFGGTQAAAVVEGM